MTEAVPDETTLCKFRHLLEANGLNKLFFDAINRVMVQTGHMMKGGTIVDATKQGTVNRSRVMRKLVCSTGGFSQPAAEMSWLDTSRSFIFMYFLPSHWVPAT